MSLEFSAIDLIILVLATYRLSGMLAHDWESGPFGLLASLRARAGLVYTEAGDPVKPPGSLIEGIMCEYCNSPWIGLVFVLIYSTLILLGLPAQLFFLPMALSGANVVIMEAIEAIG